MLVDDALDDGRAVPGQRLGELLLAGGPAAGRYPLLPPGSVAPSPAQLAATLASVAASERNQVT